MFKFAPFLAVLCFNYYFCYFLKNYNNFVCGKFLSVKNFEPGASKPFRNFPLYSIYATLSLQSLRGAFVPLVNPGLLHWKILRLCNLHWIVRDWDLKGMYRLLLRDLSLRMCVLQKTHLSFLPCVFCLLRIVYLQILFADISTDILCMVFIVIEIWMRRSLVFDWLFQRSPCL